MVIAADLQGHGRTADIDRPFSYEAMADDVAGLIRYLELAVLPATSHYTIFMSPALPDAVTPFLDAPMPSK